MQVNNRMVLSGVQNLDYHAPDALRERWEGYRSENSLAAGMTTTVYHFGLSEEDQSVVAYAYRSKESFVSEPLRYGFGLKPACTLTEGDNLIEKLPSMMNEQRENERKKPQAERVYIGGEGVAIHLTKDRCSIVPIFQFDDYSEQMQEIFEDHDAERKLVMRRSA